MTLRKHRRRQSFLSATNLWGRHLGVVRVTLDNGQRVRCFYTMQQPGHLTTLLPILTGLVL